MNDQDTYPPKFSMYTVESVCLETGRLSQANRLAISVQDALRLERKEFGYPYFKVLRAWPRIEKK